MILLIIIALILFGCPLLYLFKYKRELKNLTEQLKDITDGKTYKYIDISLIDGTLEELAVQMNHVIKEKENMFINVRNEEQKLKESIANISHDLRTPLTSILGYTFLAQNSKNQDVDAALEVIDKKAKSLNSLINSFYELSLLDDDKAAFRIEKIDIVKTITNCLMGCFALFEDRDITPNIKLPETAVFIYGNDVACERIFQNLLSNAVRYANENISIELYSSTTECVVTITNDTDLQDEDVVLHLFDRFYTADQSRSSGSTGLGLYIVKILLDKTGGTVKSTLLQDGKLSISIAFPFCSN
ncbi:MAG: sensor histidine kinase [Lachnospiraceae bacterium]